MLKVLIVDDPALMRRQLRLILENTGEMEVQTARNGQEALERIKDFAPEVVTLDVNMPEMDGMTCLAHIMRNSPRPVVMVSSITTDDLLRRHLATPSDGVAVNTVVESVPGTNGVELVRQARKLPGGRFTPILLLTRGSEQKKQDDAKAPGATGWLVKPVGADKLLQAIKQIVPGD